MFDSSLFGVYTALSAQHTTVKSGLPEEAHAYLSKVLVLANLTVDYCRVTQVWATTRLQSPRSCQAFSSTGNLGGQSHTITAASAKGSLCLMVCNVPQIVCLSL